MQLISGLVGFLSVGFISFAFFTGKGVHFVELSGLQRLDLIGSRVKIRRKAAPMGITRLQFGNDKADLQAPVAQMNVADNLMTGSPGNPFDGFTDDSRAQMPDM